MAKRKAKRVNPILEAKRLDAQRQAGDEPLRRSTTSKRRSQRGKRKSKKGLQLSPWVIAAACIYFVGLVTFIFSTRGTQWDIEQLAPYTAGAFLFSLAVIAVPTLIVWTVSNSHRAGNITAAALIGFLSVSLIIAAVVPPQPASQAASKNGAAAATASAGQSENAAASTLAASDRFAQFFDAPATTELIARTGAGAADAADAPARLVALAERAERLSRGATGDARVFEVIGQTLRDFEPLYADYARLNTEYVNSGGLAPATLPQRELIDQRIALCGELRASVDAVHRFLLEHRETLPEQLQQIGFPESDTKRIAGWWLEASRWSYALPLRYHERDMLGHHQAALELMRDSFGYWQVGSRGELRFTDLPEQMQHRQVTNRINATLNNYRPILANLDRSLRSLNGQSVSRPPARVEQPETLVAEPDEDRVTLRPPVRSEPATPKAESNLGPKERGQPSDPPAPEPVVAFTHRLDMPPSSIAMASPLPTIEASVGAYATRIQQKMSDTNLRDDRESAINWITLLSSVNDVREPLTKAKRAMQAPDAKDAWSIAAFNTGSKRQRRMRDLSTIQRELLKSATALQTTEEKLRQALASRGFDSDRIDRVVESWPNASPISTLEPLLKAEADLTTRYRDYVLALHEAHDGWETDAEGVTRFRVAAQGDRVKRALDAIISANEEIASLRRDAIERLEQSQTPPLPDMDQR
jgi:hypothetical protein